MRDYEFLYKGIIQLQRIFTMSLFLSWDCANKTLGWSLVSIDTHIYSKISTICDLLDEYLKQHLGPNYKLPCVEFTILLQNPSFFDMIAQYILTLDHFMDNFIHYYGAGVVDTLGDLLVKDTDEIQRTIALKKYLTNGPTSLEKLTGLGFENINVLIEHQPTKIGMKTNNKSTTVSHQLAFYYADYNVKLIEPKLKNTIALGSGLTRDDVLTKVLALTNTDEKIKKRKDGVKPTNDNIKPTKDNIKPAKDGIKTAKDVKYKVNKTHSLLNFEYFIKAFGWENIVDMRRGLVNNLADSTMQILAHLVKNNLFV